MSRNGAEHSMRERGVASRAGKPERPGGEGGGTAGAPGLERQARAAWEEDAGAGTAMLMEEVVRRENVKAAYERVVRNGGAA